MFSEGEDGGKNEPGHDDAAEHEHDGRDEARPLQAAQPHYRMTARAAARVTCAEAYQEAAGHQEDEATQGEKPVPSEDLRWKEMRGVRDALRRQVGLRGFREHDRVRVAQELGSDEGPCGDTAHEEQVPCLLLPIILEELDVGRYARRAEVAQRTADAESLVAYEQQVRDREADEGTCHVPRPGLFDRVEHDFRQVGWLRPEKARTMFGLSLIHI